MSLNFGVVAGDTEDFITVEISFWDKIEWKVQRSRAALYALCIDIAKESHDTRFPRLILSASRDPTAATSFDEDAESSSTMHPSNCEFEDFLNSIIAFKGSDIWSMTKFLNFFDDFLEQSKISLVRFELMAHQIANLQRSAYASDERMSVMEKQLRELAGSLQQIVPPFPAGEQRGVGVGLRHIRSNSSRTIADSALTSGTCASSSTTVINPNRPSGMPPLNLVGGRGRGGVALHHHHSITSIATSISFGSHLDDRDDDNDDDDHDDDDGDSSCSSSSANANGEDADACQVSDSGLSALAGGPAASDESITSGMGGGICDAIHVKPAVDADLFDRPRYSLSTGGGGGGGTHSRAESMGSGIISAISAQHTPRISIGPLVEELSVDTSNQSQSVGTASPRQHLLEWQEWKNSAGSAEREHAANENEGADAVMGKRSPRSPQRVQKELREFVTPSNPACWVYQPICDVLVDAVKTTEEQRAYRISIMGWIKRQIRRALGCNSFAIGLQEINCHLPEDPIRLSVVLSRNQSVNWHKTLMDRLQYVANKAVLDPSYDIRVDEDLMGAAGGEEAFSPVRNHTIGSVGFTSSKAECTVQFGVDSATVDCHIVLNASSSLCMVAFFEELADLVGNNHLFKRSMLLIRAWWAYETASYVVGTVVKDYLSELTIGVMVCAVFNQYHRSIETPFHALCLFLAEYSRYDGSAEVISLQGIVPFKSDESCKPRVRAPCPTDLIRPELIEKYVLASNIEKDLDESQLEGLIVPLDSSSSDDYQGPVGVLAPPFSLSASSLSPTAAAAAATAPSAGAGATGSDAMPPYYKIVAGNLNAFERFGFNVLNPFDLTNMVAEKLSRRRVARISKVFLTAASRLSRLMTEDQHANALPLEQEQHRQRQHQNGVAAFFSESDPHVLFAEMSMSATTAFFPSLGAKFLSNWAHTDALAVRSEQITAATRAMLQHEQQQQQQLGYGIRQQQGAANAYQEMSPWRVLDIRIDALFLVIQYCHLVVDSIVTDTALISVLSEILIEKGPLPVGEIGKMLTELTSNPNISSKLKECFGGLKKFVERSSYHFIVANDHPFNPHVILRKTLSPQHLEMIERGIFPLQSIVKSKKQQMSVSKKKKNISGSGSGGGGGAASNSKSGVSSLTSLASLTSTTNEAAVPQRELFDPTNYNTTTSNSSGKNHATNSFAVKGLARYPSLSLSTATSASSTSSSMLASSSPQSSTFGATFSDANNGFATGAGLGDEPQGYPTPFHTPLGSSSALTSGAPSSALASASLSGSFYNPSLAPSDSFYSSDSMSLAICGSNSGSGTSSGAGSGAFPGVGVRVEAITRDAPASFYGGNRSLHQHQHNSHSNSINSNNTYNFQMRQSHSRSHSADQGPASLAPSLDLAPGVLSSGGNIERHDGAPNTGLLGSAGQQAQHHTMGALHSRSKSDGQSSSSNGSNSGKSGYPGEFHPANAQARIALSAAARSQQFSAGDGSSGSGSIGSGGSASLRSLHSSNAFSPVTMNHTNSNNYNNDSGRAALFSSSAGAGSGAGAGAGTAQGRGVEGGGGYPKLHQQQQHHVPIRQHPQQYHQPQQQQQPFNRGESNSFASGQETRYLSGIFSQQQQPHQQQQLQLQQQQQQQQLAVGAGSAHASLYFVGTGHGEAQQGCGRSSSRLSADQLPTPQQQQQQQQASYENQMGGVTIGGGMGPLYARGEVGGSFVESAAALSDLQTGHKSGRNRGFAQHEQYAMNHHHQQQQQHHHNHQQQQQNQQQQQQKGFLGSQGGGGGGGGRDADAHAPWY